jgi:hypothetical protein
VTQEIRKLLDDFSKHGLVREAQADHTRSLPLLPPLPNLKLWPGSWFEVYGDMKGLLLLDPVHEVNEGTWPPPPSEPIV